MTGVYSWMSEACMKKLHPLHELCAGSNKITWDVEGKDVVIWLSCLRLTHLRTAVVSMRPTTWAADGSAHAQDTMTRPFLQIILRFNRSFWISSWPRARDNGPWVPHLSMAMHTQLQRPDPGPGLVLDKHNLSILGCRKPVGGHDHAA